LNPHLVSIGLKLKQQQQSLPNGPNTAINAAKIGLMGARMIENTVIENSPLKVSN
jgi:hypothetical protein